MGDRECSVDYFSRTIDELLGEVETGIGSRLPQALSQSLQLGKRRVKAGAAQFKGSGDYARGLSARRDPDGRGSYTGHIYNKDLPGLPHLLEKGHAKVGGGRVAGRSHIAPAAEDAFEDFERRVRKAVDESL